NPALQNSAASNNQPLLGTETRATISLKPAARLISPTPQWAITLPLGSLVLRIKWVRLMIAADKVPKAPTVIQCIAAVVRPSHPINATPNVSIPSANQLYPSASNSRSKRSPQRHNCQRKMRTPDSTPAAINSAPATLLLHVHGKG